jgi:putative ABC transport system permease protein
LFAAGIAIATALLFGLAPALRMSGVGLTSAMNQSSGRTTETAAQRRVRMLLVGGEVCLATVLLVGSGLLIRSFLRVSGVDPGFDPDRVLTMNMSLSSARYKMHPDRARFFDRVLTEVRTLPGVRSAAIATKLPLLGGSNGSILIEGQPRPKTYWDAPLVEFSRVSTGYFKTMGIRFMRGRDFEERDREGSTGVVIVNEILARTFWKGQDPIGKRLAGRADKPAWKQVIGVVRDVRQWGLEQKPISEMYMPLAQESQGYVSLVARSDGDPLSLASSVKERIRAVDAEQPVFDVDTMEHITANQLGWRTFNTSLLLAFAAIAMTLASIGIYGVISYSVAQRVPEIGIRMALGAGRRDVLDMVLRQGMAPAILGAAAGILLSFVAARLLSTLLYGVTPTDAVTLVTVAVSLVLVAALASYIPARRAASVDPINALRYE